MEYKIRKMEQGGGFATFTPFLDTLPSAPMPTATSNTSSEPTSIIGEDMFKELMTKGGLSNEVDALVAQLVKLENESANPYLKSSNRSMALKMISKVNELRQNKNLWDDAIKVAKESGGLGEVAVGSSGEVYTQIDGKIKAISLGTYNKHRDSMQLMTVSELLTARQKSPQLINQNGIFDVANQAIGMNKITDHINDMIKAFGTETNINSNYLTKDQLADNLANRFSGRKPTGDEINAVKSLEEISKNPDLLYKVKTEDSSERRQAMKAVNYIWKTLGVQAQQKLTASAAINGEANPQQFILDMIATNTDEKKSLEITPEKTPGTDTSEGSKRDRSLTQFQMFHKDKLMTPNTTFASNDPKMGILFRGSVGGVSPIIAPNGDNIGMNTISTILNSGYNAFLKSNEAFFGNKKINTSDLNNVVYDGQDAAKVYMPVGNDGGPDYEAFGEFKDVYAIYEANKDSWTPKQSEDHFKKNGYTIKIDEKYEDGQQVKVIRDNAYVKPFLVMYGYTNDATELINGNEDWVTPLSSDEEDAILPSLKMAWTVGTGKTTKDMSPNKGWNIEDYYKGMIAIPYRTEASAIIDAMVGQGPKDKVSSLVDVQRNLNYSTNQPLDPNTSGFSLNK